MYEATGTNRSWAATNYDIFRAHVDAGFTEEQAMTMTQTITYSAFVANAISPGGNE